MLDRPKQLLLTMIRAIFYLYFKSCKIVFKHTSNYNDFFRENYRLIDEQLDLNYIDFRFHQASIAISHLEHKLSLEYLQKLNKKIIWSNPMPDVRLYMLTHSGCYYSAVGSIILNHSLGSKFIVPVLPSILDSLPGKSIKRLEHLGYIVEVGSIDDHKFLISMFKAAKKEHNTKIIMFVDLPSSTMSKGSANQNVYFFNRKARLISGHINLITQASLSYCLVSYNHNPFKTDYIRCTRAYSFSYKCTLDNFCQTLTNEIQHLIKISPIDWRYLESIEFYFHHH
ncbi:hypothetical protein [Aliivibrio fischeri]|uniref:Lipid A biosynthesis lauroyl acyltransferase n=1 Tax=Aliivibrio fischeri TaxID=668 RepID=A0A844P8T2_ALIFS|nr:hypothetical protein [Aliivibrio fischeri]MUK51527.1 hypothetical protein [Aliivibrio fischeri]